MLKTYNTYHIDNTGEFVTQRLFNDFQCDKNEWHVLHSVHISEHTTQDRGECDYIVISKFGIQVVEVKNKVIKFEDGSFWEKERPNNSYSYKRMDKNPFDQVFGNQSSIQKFLRKNKINNVYVSATVVFPKTTFNYDGVEYDHYWDLNADPFIEFIQFEMEKQKFNHIEKYPNDNKLLVNEAIEQANRKSQINFNILHGLDENRRLLIQGPPGSGKSKYAYELIKKSVLNENEKGLYLCWNELLANSINNRFLKDKISDNIYAIPYFKFVKKLMKEAGMTEELSFDNSDKIKDFTEQSIALLKSQNKLKKFDFIVVDEAQDIFDKGIYSILNEFLTTESGIEKGKYFVFYDEKQFLTNNIDIAEYELVLDFLKEYSAIYKLSDNFRAIGGPGIKKLIEEIHERRFDLTKDYGNDVSFIKYKKIEDLPSDIIGLIRKESINKEDLCVLFTSNLINGNAIIQKQKPLDNLMPDDFIKLNNENLVEETNKIRYTTALKYKGLEDNIIILVVNDLENTKRDIVYQFFIGASRAKANLHVLYNE